MSRFLLLIKVAVMVVLFGIVMSGCKHDDYFDRPTWLAKPIYQYLENRGNFTHYLACVDKTGFARTLKSSGFYTVFVPDDNAFKAFMAEHGINSTDDISAELAHKIVSYSLTSVASRLDELDDFQRPVTPENEHTNLDIAFKRATFNYKGVYNYTGFDGINRYVIDINAVVANPDLGANFMINDFNMKNIPFFSRDFFRRKEIPESDYNFFFPDATFSGFNVVNARVIESDIITENGIIHVVDKVILPLYNLEEILKTTAESSDFFEILQKYMVEYTMAPREILLRNEQATGAFRDIFVKDYPSLHFAPNCENFLRYGGGYMLDTQIDGWTLFAPTNEALQNYLQNVLLARGYRSLDHVPPFVLREFINAHFFRTTVWPSQFANVRNHFGEPARFDPITNVVKGKIGSNGFFYLVNKVQEANAFSTILGEVLLNPSYTTMYQALVSTLNDFQLKNPILDLDVFLVSNQQFESMGLWFNLGTGQWEHNNPAWLNMSAFMILDRMMHMNIISGQDVNITSGFGLVETNGGEYLRYFNIPGQRPRIWGAGQTIATASQLLPSAGGGYGTLTSNGQAFTLDRPLMFSTNNIGHFLETNASYRAFFNYLDKSARSVVEGSPDPNDLSRMIYNPVTKAITGIPSTANQTYLIPNAAAIARAVTDGLLPPITAASFTQAEQEQVLRFIRYHVINNKIIYPGSGYHGIAYTHYRDVDGATHVSILSPNPTQLEIFDRRGRRAVATATATGGHTNVLANRAVIHLIDNYLDYRPN